MSDAGPTHLVVAPRLLTDLHASGDPDDAAARTSYFGADPGGYSEGDQHLGVRVPVVRGLVRSSWRAATAADLDLLVSSEFHEARLAAALLAAAQFKRADEATAARLVSWAVEAVEAGHLDNWDLVDSIAPPVVGEWVLADLTRFPVLDQLSRSPQHWSRRFALVATQALIRGGEFGPTLDLTASAVSDDSVWVHKAAGWMLRELGQRDRAGLNKFLDSHAAVMPRVMLRAALEKHDPEPRRWYLDAARRATT